MNHQEKQSFGVNTNRKKAPGRKTAYIIVHPDDFALNVSDKICDIESYKLRLVKKIKDLLKLRVNVVLLNLTAGVDYFPGFLLEVKGRIAVIPSLNNDKPNAQVVRLKRLINSIEKIDHLIFTGGWKNACLKHTINHTITETERIRFVDKVSTPIKATFKFQSICKKVVVEVDQDFVF